ncbi:MAG: hypothetical protein HDR88_10655 [Bacteroides sp.]|nr:hypothetical protein [Bacteroides sp.]
MGKKNLGNATAVSSILKSNGVFVEVNGSVRRITLDNFMNSINTDDEQLLRQIAWGVPINQGVSSPEWGVVGNTGMWNEYKSMVGRYLVTNDGKAAKLSSVNSGIFADGTTLDETKGHVMVIAPRLYYTVKRDAATNVDYLWMSMLPIGGHFIGDADGGDYICVGAYKASLVGTALTSRSGVKPQGAKTITQFWNAAQVNGKNWGLVNYDHRRYMMMLCLSQYGNPNVQAKVGYGVAGSSSVDIWATAQNLLTGATKSLGDANGKINITVTNGDIKGVDCSRVNLNGFEDAWGWQWEMIQGAYFGNSANTAQNGNEFYIYEGNRMPSDAELATHPTGKYRQIVRRTVSSDTSGYIEKMTLGEYFDLISTKAGGGSNSYWCDYEYINNTGQLLLWGGRATGGSYCGLGCVYSRNAFSYSSANYGSRLAYYGPLTFMDGKELMATV